MHIKTESEKYIWVVHCDLREKHCEDVLFTFQAPLFPRKSKHCEVNVRSQSQKKRWRDNTTNFCNGYTVLSNIEGWREGKRVRTWSNVDLGITSTYRRSVCRTN